MIHIGRNGQNLGTFPEDQIQAKVQAGELLPTDLAWAEGMAQWVPLSQIVSLAAGTAQVSEGTAAPLPLEYRVADTVGGDSRPLPWKKPLQYYCVFAASDLILELYALLASPADQVNPSDLWVVVGLVLMILMGVGYLLTVIYGYIFHYRCYKALPPKYRYLSPGNAVGLIFVPIFNLFWIFLSYGRLARGYRDWGQEHGTDLSSNLPKLAMVLATVWSVSWLGWISINGQLLVPHLNILTAPLLGVLYVQFYKSIVKQAQAIHGQQPAQ